MVKLSKRLSHLADMVTYPVLADVGTDHAYLPIYLLQSGKIRRAYALDIGDGPLLAAKEHILACGLGDYITVRLSDGVKELGQKEADAILIAGMGGDVMLHILEDGKSVIESAKELILQPQSKIELVRNYLYQSNYVIDKEDMVLEDGKYYTMFHVSMEYSDKKEYSLEEWEMIYRYGEVLLQKSGEVFKQYLLQKIRQYTSILNRLENQKQKDTAEKRKEEIKKEIVYARRTLEWNEQIKKEMR